MNLKKRHLIEYGPNQQPNRIFRDSNKTVNKYEFKYKIKFLLFPIRNCRVNKEWN